MAAMSYLSEIEGSTADPLLSSPSRFWFQVFLLRASVAAGGDLVFLGLLKKVVHATMSMSLRTCATAWASSV